MTQEKLDYCYNWLIDKKLFTALELNLITNMMGYNIDTLNLAIYCRLGYRNIDDLINDIEKGDY